VNTCVCVCVCVCVHGCGSCERLLALVGGTSACAHGVVCVGVRWRVLGWVVCPRSWRTKRQAKLRAKLSQRRLLRQQKTAPKKGGRRGRLARRGMMKWPTPHRVNKMKHSEQALLRRTSVDKALEKVTSLMSALGGEDSLLAHVFLTSDLHSIPVAYPKGFYKASNWEGRCLQDNPVETGQAQLGHAYSGAIAAHNARTRSTAMVEFGVRVIVKEDEALIVDAVFDACMTEGALDLIKLDALHRNPPLVHKHNLDVRAVTAMLERQRGGRLRDRAFLRNSGTMLRQQEQQQQQQGTRLGRRSSSRAGSSHNPSSRSPSRATGNLSRSPSRSGTPVGAGGGDGSSPPRMGRGTGVKVMEPVRMGTSLLPQLSPAGGSARTSDAPQLLSGEVQHPTPLFGGKQRDGSQSTLQSHPTGADQQQRQQQGGERGGEGHTGGGSGSGGGGGDAGDIAVAPMRGAIEGDDGFMWAPGRNSHNRGNNHNNNNGAMRHQRGTGSAGTTHPLTKQLHRQQRQQQHLQSSVRSLPVDGTRRVRGASNNSNNAARAATGIPRRLRATVSARLLVPTRSSQRVHGLYYGHSQERGAPTCRRCTGAGCKHRSASDRFTLALRRHGTEGAIGPSSGGGGGGGLGDTMGHAVMPPDPLHLRVDPSIHAAEKDAAKRRRDKSPTGGQDGRPSTSNTTGTEQSMMDQLSLSLYVGDKTPILHATAPNLMRARLKMQHGLPLESSMLMAAVDELQELSKEATYAKRHMEMSGRHAVQEFYKAKAKLKHCKQEIRAYIYEVDETEH